MFKKIATGLATGALLLGSTLPVFADVTVDVNGNGTDSNNTVSIREKCVQKVKQSNTTNANVNLNLSGNTGNNNANDNTGGTTTVNTGDVSNTATVTVTGGDNTAEIPNCCCGEDGNTTEVTVEKNGSNTTNTVRVKKVKKQKVKQKTRTNATVVGSLSGTTGSNDANDNTGSGTEIDTGKVTNEATVEVSGGSNNL